MTVVQSYFERVQRRLQAEGTAARSFHHGSNRGQIREAFVREFLSQNISSLWDIGTGEIIHHESSPDETRSQIDVVIHNRKFPKLSLATGIDLFFVETVSSFIEIKSRLTEEDVRKAAATTKKIKSLAEFPPQKINPSGLVKTPRPYSFLFAYDGPRRISTLLDWIKRSSSTDDYGIEGLRETPPEERSFYPHHFIDGVFVLGLGFVFLDALPFQSQIARAIEKGLSVPPATVWVSGEEQELLMLWALINGVNERLQWNEANLNPYGGTIMFTLHDAEDGADGAVGG